MSRIQIPRKPDPDVQDPEAAKSENRRQWPRYAFPKQESFTLTADGRISICAIEDISLGGARLRMEGSVPGDLELRIEHPRLGHAFARPCWKAEAKFFAKTRQGIRSNSFSRQIPSSSVPTASTIINYCARIF